MELSRTHLGWGERAADTKIQAFTLRFGGASVGPGSGARGEHVWNEVQADGGRAAIRADVIVVGNGGLYPGRFAVGEGQAIPELVGVGTSTGCVFGSDVGVQQCKKIAGHKWENVSL